MDSPYARQLDWMRELHASAIDILADWGQRIGTWVVLGNAGALVVIFNAVISGTSCSPADFMPSIWCFAGGLISGFIGAISMQALSSRLTVALGDMINTQALIEIHKFDLSKIEQQHGEQPADSHLAQCIERESAKFPQQVQRAERIKKVAMMCGWFSAVAALLFAVGLILPITNHHLLVSCAQHVASQAHP